MKHDRRRQAPGLSVSVLECLPQAKHRVLADRIRAREGDFADAAGSEVHPSGVLLFGHEVDRRPRPHNRGIAPERRAPRQTEMEYLVRLEPAQVSVGVADRVGAVVVQLERVRHERHEFQKLPAVRVRSTRGRRPKRNLSS